MYFYIAARKDTQVELEKVSNNIDFSSSEQRNVFREALCANYSISDNNLSVYYVSEPNENVTRVTKGDTYTLTWTASTPDGEIDGVDFSAEDAKKWLQFSANKSNLIAGEETVIISVNLLKADKTGIDTTFSDTIDVPVTLPNRNSKFRFNFISGQASTMKTFNVGGTVYLGDKPSGYRCDNTLTIDVVE